jgi:hypothetical protein
LLKIESNASMLSQYSFTAKKGKKKEEKKIRGIKDTWYVYRS